MLRKKQFYDWQEAITLIQGFWPLLLADKLHNVPHGEVILASLDLPTLEQLHHHRLTPLLYREVMRQGLEKHLQHSLLEHLRQDYIVALRATAREDQEVLRVLQALNQAGIGSILLKGADLRIRLYGESAVRPMADLDLLISPGHVSRVKSILEELGLTLQSQCTDPRPGFRELFRNELHFNPPPGGLLLVDLHWHLSGVDNFYTLPFHRLEEMALPWNYQGQPVKVLCPEHALIHSALHTFEEFHGAMQIVDLGRTLRTLPLHWPTLQEELIRFQCQAPVYLILRELAPVFPHLIPGAILHDLSGYRPSWAERLVLNHSLGYFTPHFAALYRHRRLHDWVFYVSALLWPQPEYLLAVYGEPDRARFLRQALRTLFSSAPSWNPE
ncbi:MAG: nucleotidyltransferase family protein [Desulfobaccales bacterium]